MTGAAPGGARAEWVEGLRCARVTPAGPGRGAPLLLVHGMWGGAWYWAAWQAVLAEAGWESWAVDLRGHHGSGDPAAAAGLGRVGVRDYVADVLAVRRQLGPAVLVGHSMGGLVAQKAAEAAGAPALVLVTSAAPRGIPVLRGPVLRRLGRYLGPILGRRPFLPGRADADALFLGGLPPEARAEAYARLVPESGRAALELALGTVGVDPRRVRGPVLVLGARRDPMTPPGVQRRIARRYGAEYRELAGHGHMPMVEPGGERVAADLAAWLARAVG